MVEKKNFIDYCKEYILNELPSYEGQTVYACDLGYTLTQAPNVNGTLTYSTYEAKEYLRSWWDECSDYVEYEKSNFGGLIHNPFENPEAFMVCMVIEGVNSILSRCHAVDFAWNDRIELSEDVIDSISNEVKALKVDRLF